MTREEFLEDFLKIEVGDIVELVAILPNYNNGKSIKMLISGLVNSITMREDDDESSLEVNGQQIKVANIVKIVYLYDIKED